MSTKKNIQAFREWAYDHKVFKIEPTVPPVKTEINPNLNSKERNRLKWLSRKVS